MFTGTIIGVLMLVALVAVMIRHWPRVNEETGALNTQFALLAGLGAVIAIAIGGALWVWLGDQTDELTEVNFTDVTDGGGFD